MDLNRLFEEVLNEARIDPSDVGLDGTNSKSKAFLKFHGGARNLLKDEIDDRDVDSYKDYIVNEYELWDFGKQAKVMCNYFEKLFKTTIQEKVNKYKSERISINYICETLHNLVDDLK
jgi:hypothetical protein